MWRTSFSWLVSTAALWTAPAKLMEDGRRKGRCSFWIPRSENLLFPTASDDVWIGNYFNHNLNVMLSQVLKGQLYQMSNISQNLNVQLVSVSVSTKTSQTTVWFLLKIEPSSFPWKPRRPRKVYGLSLLHNCFCVRADCLTCKITCKYLHSKQFDRS